MGGPFEFLTPRKVPDSFVKIFFERARNPLVQLSSHRAINKKEKFRREQDVKHRVMYIKLRKIIPKGNRAFMFLSSLLIFSPSHFGSSMLHSIANARI